MENLWLLLVFLFEKGGVDEKRGIDERRSYRFVWFIGLVDVVNVFFEIIFIFEFCLEVGDGCFVVVVCFYGFWVANVKRYTEVFVFDVIEFILYVVFIEICIWVNYVYEIVLCVEYFKFGNE